MCVYTSEAWHTGVVNNTNPKNFLFLYQIGLKLSLGTVLTSRQIRWSPNFSHTIEVTPLESGGQRSSLAPLQCMGKGLLNINVALCGTTYRIYLKSILLLGCSDVTVKVSNQQTPKLVSDRMNCLIYRLQAIV